MTKISNLYSLTNYITANTSGNIVISAPSSGIGLTATTASFTTGLTVSNVADVYPEFKTSASDADAFLGFSNTGDGNAAWSIGRRNTGDFWISTYTGNFNSGTRTQPLTITSTGNVGIQTTSAGYPLQIRKTTNVNIGFGLQNGGISLEAVNDAVNANIPMSYYATSHMFLNGNVLIGKTSSGSPDRFVDAAGGMYSSGSTAGYFWENRSSSSTFAGWYTTSATIYLYQSSTGNIASINYTSGAYTALSDINKKKDFELSTIGLYEVMQLKPTLYRMKSDDTNGTKELGFIAQEVKDYIPQAYVESEDFIGLNFNPIVAALTKAIQELSAKVTALENK